jgi:DNA-directed RNA polymerase specialized sigma24 family protein
VRAYLRHVTRDEREVDALLADVVGELWCSLEPDPDPNAMWPRALQILQRIARTERKRRRREASVLNPHPATFSPTTEDHQAYRVALAEWEDTVLGHLGPSQRTALELHVMEDLSDEQIATILDCQVESVRKLRYKAKQVCRALLKAGVVSAPPADPTRA